MWKKCSEKYEVSTDGHIRNIKTGRVLHEYTGKDRYLRIQFRGKTRLVHRVVAEVFIPNPNNFLEVNHKDGNKSNNAVENLEWCTRNENLRHAYANNLRNAKGINNSRCKLSENDVRFVKERYIKGDKKYGALALSKRFGVAHQTICAVVSGQNWKDFA